MYSTEIKTAPPTGAPHAVERSSLTWVKSTASTSLNNPGAHEEGLAAQKFLGDARPDHQRTGKFFALHEVLDCERRDDIDRLSRIVTFAMARRSFDQWLAIGDAGLLRRFRKAIDIAAERNDRTAGAPARDPGWWVCPRCCARPRNRSSRAGRSDISRSRIPGRPPTETKDGVVDALARACVASLTPSLTTALNFSIRAMSSFDLVPSSREGHFPRRAETQRAPVPPWPQFLSRACLASVPPSSEGIRSVTWCQHRPHNSAARCQTFGFLLRAGFAQLIQFKRPLGNQPG